jgi:hypothetical protein
MRYSSLTLALIGIALLLWPLEAMAQWQPNDCGFYANRNGDVSARNCESTMQAPPPQRVTAVCRDQSYSYDQGSSTCWEHGGVQTWRH